MMCDAKTQSRKETYIYFAPLRLRVKTLRLCVTHPFASLRHPSRRARGMMQGSAYQRGLHGRHSHVSGGARLPL